MTTIGRKRERSGNAKVSEAGGSIAGDKDVVGLDIAMQNEKLMKTLKRTENAEGDVDNVVVGKRLLVAQTHDVGERAKVAQFQNQLENQTQIKD